LALTHFSLGSFDDALDCVEKAQEIIGDMEDGDMGDGDTEEESLAGELKDLKTEIETRLAR